MGRAGVAWYVDGLATAHMKKLLSKKAVLTIAGVAIAGATVLIVWNVFDIGTRMTLSGAINDILAGRNVGQARQALHDLAKETGRAEVIAALKEAVGEDTDSVQGKMNLIDALSAFKEPRAVRRALGSKSVSSRRAAAWKFHADKSVKDSVRTTVIEWIRDDNADKRGLAAMIVNKLQISECIPALYGAIKSTPETNEQLQFAQQALDALATFKPDGLAERVMEIAEDEEQHSMLRGRAFRVAIRLDDVPFEKLQGLLLRIVKNPEANNILRNMAAGVLRGEKFGNADAWTVLEAVLLSEGDDPVIQRGCLYALGDHAPLERIKNLLLDRRVYNHAYFGIRVDVASGLAALHVQEKLALEIMCTYMVDEDDNDKDLLVSQEGFLTFWALTGLAAGIAEQVAHTDLEVVVRLFQRTPKAIPSEEGIRKYLWSASFLRLGVSQKMVEAVQQLTTSNLAKVKSSVLKGIRRPAKQFRRAKMQSVAQISRSKIDQLLESTRKRKEAAERAKEEADKAKDQGPKLPPKEDDSKKEDADQKKDGE